LPVGLMKKLGIIGGMGPEATNQLVLKIIDGFKALGQKTRPDILVAFVPVNLENETRLINNNEFGDFQELLVNAAKSLENAGSDFIIIACNSVHVFVDLVRKSIKIPVFSVLEETEKFLKRKKIKRTAIIGSSFTINNKLFEFDDIGLVKPDKKTQKQISLILDRLAKSEKNCLLACSETQLLNFDEFNSKVNFIDTMQILADKAVNIIKE